MNQGLNQQSFEVIRKGSKSFFLAGLLFDKNIRDDAFKLYHWCRYCDDAIDESQQDVNQQLIELKTMTKQARSNNNQNLPAPFQALGLIGKKYSIPQFYCEELLEGMKMDASNFYYKNEKELKLYCYRVAGVVGLMMTHIMGVSDEKALRYACDMGIAMQLTNIARDITTDYKNDRIYIPEEWLQELNLNRNNFTDTHHRSELFSIAQRLLKMADSHYASGRQGLRYLSFRNAFTIASAQNIYAEIGKVILKRKTKAWNQRAFTSQARKVVLVIKSFFQVLKIKGSKFFRPWKAKPLKRIWRWQ